MQREPSFKNLTVKQESELKKFVSNKAKDWSVEENFAEKIQATPAIATSAVNNKQWFSQAFSYFL